MAVITELFALAVPILAILLAFGIPMLAIYLDYKKKIAMIEKGMMPEEEKCCHDSRLGWGIAILGIGISLIIGWIYHLDEKVIIGLALTSIGIALLVSYLTRYKENSKDAKII